jgi:hypothetical protein
MRSRHQRNDQLGAAMLAGAIGGIAGTWAMSAAQTLWLKTLGPPIASSRESQRATRARAGASSRTPFESGANRSATPRAASSRVAQRRTREAFEKNAGIGGHLAQSEPRSQHRHISPSERLAATVWRNVLGRPIDPATRELVGFLTHYAFGGTAGAAYGALTERTQRASTLTGLTYGTAVWAVADEIAIPALGLADSPLRSPPAAHAYALVGHFAYGVTTELVRRMLRGNVGR